MITLHVQSLNQQQQVLQFSCVVNQLDTALGTLSLIAAGNTLLEVYIIEDGHQTNLPPQAFDGYDVARPIRALQADWEALLSQPSLQSLPVQEKDWLSIEVTLQRIDMYETLMGEYDMSITKLQSLITQTAEVLHPGPQKERLLGHYRGIVLRQGVLLEQVQAKRGNLLTKLTRLKQA